MKVLRRVKHIAGYFNLRLVEAAMADYSFTLPPPYLAKRILHELSEFDPTVDNHLMFLARCYSEGMFLFKDKEKIKAMLAEFEVYKKNLNIKITDHMLKLSELEVLLETARETHKHHKEILANFPTGFTSFDKVNGGIGYGELFVIGGSTTGDRRKVVPDHEFILSLDRDSEHGN